MNLYLIRHALPDYENDSITELVKTQAAALAEWLKDIKEHCHCMPRRCDFSPYYSTWPIFPSSILFRIWVLT